MSKAYIWVMFIVSAIFGGLVLVLSTYGILSSGYEVIPNLIVVASIVMGMVTLTLTIMMAIKGGTAYKMAKRRRPEILEQIYGYASAALISGLFTIGLSLLIIMTKQYISSSTIYKGGCVWGLATTFAFMIVTVAMSYWQSIQLLGIDDEE